MTARTEVARVQLARERLAEDDPSDARLARREAELLRLHRKQWQVHDFRDVFRHGEVVEVRLDAYLTKPTLKTLLTRAPQLEKISLSGWATRSPKQWAAMFSEPSLTRLHELWVQDDKGHAAFIASPAAKAMRRLELTPSQAKLVAKGGYAVKEAAGREGDSRWVTALGPALASIEALTLDQPTDATIAVLVKQATSLRRLVLEEPHGSLRLLPELSRRLETLDVRAALTPVQASSLARCSNVTALSCYLSKAPLLPLLRRAAKTLRSLMGAAMEGRILERVRFKRLRTLKLYMPRSVPHDFPTTLTSLEIDCATRHDPLVDDGHVARLRKSRILRRLCLEFCDLGDSAGRLVATWPKAAGLHSLDLNGNHILDTKVVKQIERRFGCKMFGYQHPIEEDHADEPEPPPPKQRPAPKLLPRRKDRVAGLKELIGRAHFATWDGYVAPKLIARAERLIDGCARALLAAPEANQLAVLRRCIVGFNRFSDAIFTIEAEDIVTTFEQLARYTKYSGEEDLADRWRDF